MGAAPAYTIWAKPPGAGGYDRVDPRFIEGIQHEHGPMGPERLSFSALMDTRLFRPEHLPYTRFYTEIAGVPAWAGYGLQAPPSRGEDSRLAINAAGMGAYLAEQPIHRRWVTTDLTEFQDSRSVGATLGALFTQASKIENDNGRVVIAFPTGSSVTAFTTLGGVTLDLGPNQTASRMVLSWESSNNDATVYLRCGVSNNPDPSAGGITGLDLQNTVGASGTSAFNMTPARYVHLMLLPSATKTLTADVLWRITSCIIFSDAADESGNASILKASTAISEMLTAGAPLVSSDHSQIAATTFNIPHLEHKGDIASGIAKANVYHARQFFLETLNGGTVRPVYRDTPTTPRWVISRHDGHHVQLSSSNDGSELYNQVAVQYVDAAGKEGEVIVTASPDTTLLGRAGRTRRATLQMKAPTTSAAATQIGNVFLSAHATTPMKGSVEARGWVRDYYTGAKVPAGVVRSNDVVFFPDEVNPDTGAVGRRGPIAAARYAHQDLALGCEIDTRADIVDALLERMAVLT